jgi:hypothetical protein
MVLSVVEPVKGALMRASAGQVGIDLVGCLSSTVDAVAGMDHKGYVDREGASEGSLFYAATLHKFWLLYEFMQG